jgi:PKD repeat protein
MLDVAAADNESPELTYTWDCGNGIEPETPAEPTASTAVCKYVAVGSYTVSVTVRNSCGRQSTRSAGVLIQE